MCLSSPPPPWRKWLPTKTLSLSLSPIRRILNSRTFKINANSIRPVDPLLLSRTSPCPTRDLLLVPSHEKFPRTKKKEMIYETIKEHRIMCCTLFNWKFARRYGFSCNFFVHFFFFRSFNPLFFSGRMGGKLPPFFNSSPAAIFSSVWLRTLAQDSTCRVAF